MNNETREKLMTISVATLATALYKRGLRNQVIQGVRPLGYKGKNMVGPAFTLRYMPAREDRNQLVEFRNPAHPQRVAIETCPPGHVLVMLQTAEALGLTKEQVLREPMQPECRAILDFKRQLMWEGTVAEWWFSMLTEEPIGHWSAMWFKTLTEKYGFTKPQAVYFSTHEEADLKEHEGGVMGHGSFNKLVMQRILEDGYADTREGYNLEYCAIAAVDAWHDRGATVRADARWGDVHQYGARRAGR